eukprot:159902_1
MKTPLLLLLVVLCARLCFCEENTMLSYDQYALSEKDYLAWLKVNMPIPESRTEKRCVKCWLKTGRIYKLNMANNCLSGTLPKKMIGLKELWDLRLGGNRFTWLVLDYSKSTRVLPVESADGLPLDAKYPTNNDCTDYEAACKGKTQCHGELSDSVHKDSPIVLPEKLIAEVPLNVRQPPPRHPVMSVRRTQPRA